LKPPQSNRHPQAEASHPADAMDQALTWLIELEVADAEQHARFEAWLDADPANRGAFAKARAVWHSQPVLDAAKMLSAPEKSGVPARSRKTWLPVATAALVLLGVFLFSDLPLRVRADHLTVAGERQHLALTNGSKVLLNTQSALSSAPGNGVLLARLLQGEAFFDVPDSKSMPLEVQAGPARMHGAGTAFAVRYLDGVAQIQVQRGDVRVQAMRGDADVNLVAGDSLRVGPEGFGLPEKSDQRKSLAWVQGRLIVENCPLAEVLTELRRYYPGWIISTNRSLDRVAVTGNYRLDSPLDIVRSLAHITSAHLHELPALVILN